MIQDLQSTNGTWMNNQRLGSQSATLRKGLSINLGKVNLRIEGDFS
jgi:pSer/pThr/pTyr-binding forkhead associated (FHA) protein